MAIFTFLAVIQLLFAFGPSSLVNAIPRPQTAAPSTASQAATPSTQSSSYWLGSIQRQGTVAYGSDPNFQIFRNVQDFGAKGDGVTDDTEAINTAISAGNRCGLDCDSSTTTPAIVYFPPGVYLVNAPIVQYYYTQFVGDALDIPTIKASASFQGIAVIDSDPYIPGGNGANWYTNQNNFFRQIRNFIIDLTSMPINVGAGIHWQVAQATSLQNIRFEMIQGGGASNKQQGIFMDNGSGGFMTDLTFNGGLYGAFFGNQQFTTRNMTFNNCQTAIYMNWNWLWTFKSLSINNCGIGIDMANGITDPPPPSGVVNQTVGSVIVLDSKMVNTPIGIKTAFSQNSAYSAPETGGTLVIDNVDFTGATVAVGAVDGSTILAGGSIIDSWAQGNAYRPAAASKKLKRQASPTPDTCSATSMAAASAAMTSAAMASASTGTAPYPGSSAASISGAMPSAMSTFPSEPSSTSLTAGSSAAVNSGVTNSATSMLSSEPSTTFSAASSSLSSSGSSFPTVSSMPLASNSPSTSMPPPVPVSHSRIQQQLTPPSLPSPLMDGSRVFERSKPQYENVPLSSFISVKSHGAKGDGVTDDTLAIQSIFDAATPDQVVYFDHGAYVITDTVNVTKNIKVTGEIWPLIMASGTAFSDQMNPRPVFRVGAPGDVGAVEMSDLIFETLGPAPGAILMEWNVADVSQGACGLWDVHFRVGGTAGTQLQQDKCIKNEKITESFRPECAGSFMMLHVTQQATAYIENVWLWVADHELDIAPHNQTDIFNGRGLFIESQGPVWLYGTSSEHSQLYNYQISNAKNIWMGAIQTETAYMQSNPNALEGGFTPQVAYGDPDFSTCTTDLCKKTWGLRIVDSSDIYMYGGGLYSFFDNYGQDCLATQSCQENMVGIEDSTDVWLFGLTTEASVNMVTVNGQSQVLGADNMDNFGQTVALFKGP